MTRRYPFALIKEKLHLRRGEVADFAIGARRMPLDKDLEKWIFENPGLGLRAASPDEVGEFKEAAGELDWSGATNADPQLLAWAFDSGMPDDALTAPEQAYVALALAERTGELMRLGYAQRDVAEAALEATRTAVGAMMATQLRNETGDTELRVMIQA